MKMYRRLDGLELSTKAVPCSCASRGPVGVPVSSGSDAGQRAQVELVRILEVLHDQEGAAAEQRHGPKSRRSGPASIAAPNEPPALLLRAKKKIVGTIAISPVSTPELELALVLRRGEVVRSDEHIRAGLPHTVPSCGSRLFCSVYWLPPGAPVMRDHGPRSAGQQSFPSEEAKRCRRGSLASHGLSPASRAALSERSRQDEGQRSRSPGCTNLTVETWWSGSNCGR